MISFTKCQFQPDLMDIRLLLICNTITMARRTTWQPSWLLTFAVLLCSLFPAEALYFYMDGATSKCFIEELPKDTLVVGMIIVR